MEELIFFSYSHIDYEDTFFKVFCDRLHLEMNIRKKKLFRDNRSIAAGADWPAEIAAALANAKVFAYVHSPSYFDSEYCGKEWRVFRDRINQFSAAGSIKYQTAMVPIVWIPVESIRSAASEEVSDIQYATADFPEVYHRKGLRSLLKNNNSAFEESLDAIVNCIIEGAKLDLPPLERVPRLKEVEPAFGRKYAGADRPIMVRPAVSPAGAASQSAKAAQPVTPEKPARPAAPMTGPKYVRYLCAAASSEEMAALRANNAKYNSGNGDWVPFAGPESLSADIIVSEAAVHARLLPQPEPLPRDPDELERLLRTWRDANMAVAIVIDPWTLRLPEYQNVLFALEKNPFPNWCRIFVWDVEEDDTAQLRERLNTQVKEVFSISLNDATSDQLDYSIVNQDAMRIELEKRLADVKSKIIRMLTMRPLRGGRATEFKSAPPFLSVTSSETG